MGWLRNPLVVGLALLATIAGAFQVAGVVSMLLADIILAAGVWIFITVEVWCSHWVKKTGRYVMCVVLFSSFGSGILAIALADLISNMRSQQAAIPNSNSSTPPATVESESSQPTYPETPPTAEEIAQDVAKLLPKPAIEPPKEVAKPDPDIQLLNTARTREAEYLSFLKSFDSYWENIISLEKKGRDDKDGGTIKARFLTIDLINKMRTLYFQVYASGLIQSRSELVRSVPGAANPALDYLNPRNIDDFNNIDVDMAILLEKISRKA